MLLNIYFPDFAFYLALLDQVCLKSSVPLPNQIVVLMALLEIGDWAKVLHQSADWSPYHAREQMCRF